MPLALWAANLHASPRTLGEALATAHMLDAKGYNFSLGVAQVNRKNLGKYGLDSYEKAFETCPNLSAGARILAECYASSNGDWGKSFSCYYSGNLVTGYRDGYVQKIYDSINRSTKTGSDINATQAIPLQPIAQSDATRSGTRVMPPMVSNRAAYRVAMRSMVLDTTISALASTTSTAPRPTSMSETTTATADVFVPQVRDLNEPSTVTAHVAKQPQIATLSTPTAPSSDQADLRQGNHDAAFVF